MLVSIITPSINGMEYLEGCIESVQNQRSQSVEVEHIFVDGGSTDGTPEFAASRGCTVLTRDENNLYVAFNKGFSHASGSLVGILGCDDLLLAGALETVVRRYEQDRLPWLVGACRWLDRDGRSRGDQPPPPRFASIEMLGSLHWSPFPSLSTYLEPALLEQLGYFDVSYEISSDYDLLLRARRLSTFSRITEALSAQHRHGGNISMQRTLDHAAEVERINEQFGAPSGWKRKAHRMLLRLLINGLSPGWYVAKRTDRNPSVTSASKAGRA